MRRLGLVTLFFVPIASCFGFEVTAQADKMLSLEADYVGLWRNELGNLGFLENITFGIPIYTKIPYKYTDGIRAMLEVNPTQYDSLQLVYSGCFHWHHGGSTSNATNQFIVSTLPYANTDWTNFSDFDYNYKADLNWGELLYWRHITRRYVDWFSFSFMLGLRYIDLRDKMTMMNQVGNAVDQAHVIAINQMCGAEGALEFLFTTVPLVSFGVQAKGGVYADVVTKKSKFQDLGGSTMAVDHSVHGVEAAYTIECIPYILLQMNPFYARVAYNNILFFNPVLAPSQIKVSKSLDEIYTHKRVYMQSLIAGLGFSW